MGPTLVWHFGALGDFVLSWPALGLLAAGPPPSETHLVGHPAWGRLILPPERVHDREARRLAPLFVSEPLNDELASWLGRFGRAVVFHQRPDANLMGHLRLAGIKDVWSVPTRPLAGQRLHAGESQVLHLRGRGLTGEAQAPSCLVAPSERRGVAVLAPGSGGKAKRLTPALAGAMAAMLAEAGAPPTLLLGPAEEPSYRAELAAACAGVEHAVLADPTIHELAALMQAARLYVGADSGVSHLAAALGAPTLAIFSASDPAVWSPRGRVAEACSPEEAPARAREILRETR